MCEDLAAEMSALQEKGVLCTPVEEARWGSVTSIPLPGGGVVGLYQPKHPTALHLVSQSLLQRARRRLHSDQTE